MERRREVPAANNIQESEIEEDGFANFLALDKSVYVMHYGSKSVRKSITVPI